MAESERKRRKLNEKEQEKAEYEVREGYRYVKPYVFKFQTHAKQRWFQRTLIDIFKTEFGSFSPEYYEQAIQTGRITLNGKVVQVSTTVKNGDLLCHKTHRHEPPVSGEEIQIAHETNDLLVVCKPAGVPTHPCGAYRYNSLHYILLHMRPDIKHLHIVHRLDRLTSGLVILAKNSSKAKELSACIADRSASKTYLARVRGDFPAEFTPEFLDQVKAQLSTPRAQVTIDEDNQWLRIKCPLICRSHKDGVWACALENDDEAKEAETIVQFYKKYDDTTVVLVKPVTGRTHQIRLHLQLIGFPIANDPCYGGILHYGSNVKTDEGDEEQNGKAEQEEKLASILPKQDDETEEDFLKRTCQWCARTKNENHRHCARIWLHAWQYELLGESYTVQIPEWA